jgi:hypothetical protein
MPKQMPKPKIDVKVHSAMLELPMDPAQSAMPKNKKDLLTSPGGIMVSVPEVDEDERDRVGRLINRAQRSKTFRRKLTRTMEKEDERVSRLETWADKVQDCLGGVRVRATAVGPIEVTLPCEGGHDVIWTSANRIPAEAIASKLKRQGWELGKHIRCPEHAHPRKERKKQEGGDTMSTDTMTQTEASEAARTAKRLTMMALEENFNVDKGCYKSGTSDATIAKELNVAPEVVERLRLEFYGPLKVPDDIEDVRRQIATVASEYRQRAHALETEVLGKISKLENRLDALVRKNKWADA